MHPNEKVQLQMAALQEKELKRNLFQGLTLLKDKLISNKAQVEEAPLADKLNLADYYQMKLYQVEVQIQELEIQLG